jgi:hypothetical protein
MLLGDCVPLAFEVGCTDVVQIVPQVNGLR